MKNIRLICFSLASGLTVALAQEKSETTTFVSERGDHHRVWERVTVETDRYDKKIYRTNAAYTELETGMNVKQPDGSWVEASDEIEIVKDGAVARKGRHRVSFAVNCNSPAAIDMLTADRKRLQSRILGLAYTDNATGQSVLIAELKDSDGQLVMDVKNEVVYYDAFTDLVCDIRYKNSKAGLEQDLILRENPPSPADYKLNPATTVLEVLTEFFNPPVPEKQVQLRDGTVNELLDFGDLKMGNGRVYVMGEETTEIPVTKQWATLDGRTFLVEQIPFPVVEPELQRLPARTAFSPSAPEGVRHQVANRRLLPTIKQARKATGPMRMASAPLSGKGVVLDYTTASSATNYTFKGDTTYYVSGTVNLSGTTTIEGGTILKYTNSSAAKLSISGSLACQTDHYRPAVFTSKDDNTVGETISGSTGNPTNYNGAMYFNGPDAYTTYQYLRLSYAGTAINAYSPQEVRHCQFIRCGTAIAAGDDTELHLRNVLFARCGTAVNIGSGNSLVGEHVTADQVNNFFDAPYCTGYLTNSLLTAVTNIGTNVSLYFCTTNSSGSGIYQTVGAGSYYLADGSTNRNAGATNINASLAADLRKLTTYPPLELTNNFTVATTLSPQAQRDTDTLDLGWHYDPLDYVVSGRTLTNSTLTLTNGVALGTYGTSSSYGIYIRKGGNLVSEGSPANLNQIVRYNTSQEQANTNWSATTVAHSVKISTDGTTKPTGSFRFTGWSLLGGRGYHFHADYPSITTPFGFKDCQFGPGGFNAAQCSVALTNCLLERSNLSLEDDGGDYGYYGYNNLFRYGSLAFSRNGSTAWILKDNLFDNSAISASSSITHDYNGYVTNQNRLSPNGAHDKILTNSPVYQTSYLGRYYYPTNGGLLNLLSDAGSRNATNATLYHFTTTTNQVKEASSTVDIGFHYVATDSNGVPIDTEGDGLADYFEDSNGNGTYGTGDLANWTVSDTDGDGLNDGLEYLQGRNPRISGIVTDTNGIIDFKVYTPLVSP